MSARGQQDYYALLGISRDATTAEIKRAYELALNRAHRDGAIRHAEDLMRAHDTLSDPRRRELYDRHGFTAIRERSPGAAPPPPPWRIAQHTQPGPARRKGRTRSGWRMPVMAVFVIGVVVGIALAVYMGRHPGSSLTPTATTPDIATRPTVVMCSRGDGSGYMWTAQPGQQITCANGARPQIRTP